MTTFICDRCHEEKTHAEPHTTGYGTNDKGERICFACCGEVDKADMIATGRATLYLTHFRGAPGQPIQRPTVSNWPGTLKINVRGISKGKHNIARTRYDVWFTGPDGKEWHGVQIGENTQICRCKRVKS